MTGASEKMMLVIDVPPDATAEQAEELLNRPFEEGYYQASIVGWDKFTARAFYKRRIKQDERDAALGVLPKDRDNAAQQIRAALAEAGIQRSDHWNRHELADIRAERPK